MDMRFVIMGIIISIGAVLIQSMPSGSWVTPYDYEEEDTNPILFVMVFLGGLSIIILGVVCC